MDELYHHISYADQWRRKSRRIVEEKESLDRPPHSRSRCRSNPTTTPAIFDLCWFCDNGAAAEASDATLLLLACTSHGEICVWESPSTYLPTTLAGENDDDDPYFAPHGEAECNSQQKPSEAATALSVKQKPYRRWAVSKGVLYSIQITAVGNEEPNQQKKEWFLIVSGDEGVLVFDWSAEARANLFAANSSNINTARPALLSQYRPHPSPWEETIEINQVVVSSSHKKGACLYGAAGDAFGCYKWDLETLQLVKTYPSPKKGYLQTLHLLKDSQQHLLTGGDDGILAIWDVNQDKLVDQINVASALDKKGAGNSNNKRKAPASSSTSGRWIGSIAASGPWWTLGGGGGGNSNNNHSTGLAGFVATFHGPTRSLICSCDTRESIHKLLYSQDGLLSVGTGDAIVSHWPNPWSLHNNNDSTTGTTLDAGQAVLKPSTTWCSPQCGYALAETTIAKTGGRTSLVAVGGVGTCVDILQENQVVFRFHVVK